MLKFGGKNRCQPRRWTKRIDIVVVVTAISCQREFLMLNQQSAGKAVVALFLDKYSRRLSHRVQTKEFFPPVGSEKWGFINLGAFFFLARFDGCVILLDVCEINPQLNIRKIE